MDKTKEKLRMLWSILWLSVKIVLIIVLITGANRVLVLYQNF